MPDTFTDSYVCNILSESSVKKFCGSFHTYFLTDEVIIRAAIDKVL